jgi:Transposase DDE domain
MWRHVALKSPATQSRWQWTWVWDDSVFHKYGEQLRVVGRWWSGQQQRVLSGIDGLLLLGVSGDGRVVVPVDFAMRRPDPVGPGAPCRDKLRWAQRMLDERLAAFRRCGVELPAPRVVAESWFSDAKLMQHVHDAHQGIVLVEGKQSSTFILAEGPKVKGQDLIHSEGWRWRSHPWEAGVRYVRLQATSPTYGPVTVLIVDEPGQARFSLLCLETERSAPQLIRRWRRRSWIEFVFRTLKHLWATEACQVRSEDAYYGHLVLRFMGCFVLFYTSRVICQGSLTMEEIIFSLKHYGRFVDVEALELQALS